MPTRDNSPVGAPCWVDLTTSDTDGARAFYARVFGWEAEEPNPEFGGYFNFTKDGVRVAGCMAKQPDATTRDLWCVYLTSDDARKTVDAAVAEGGQLHVEPMPVGDLGTMAYVSDSGGAFIGIWQPNTFPGFGLVGEAGAPSWWELQTRDYDAAVSFYRNVFRWDTSTMSDTAELRYTTFGEGENAQAGIMDATGYLPEGVPNQWSVYFGVDDADATLVKIVELGGSVVVPAMDTPYGRLAAATDPTGAQFKIVAPNEAMPAKS